MAEIKKAINFGWFIFWQRTRKGWTRKRLAEETGLTERTIIRLEQQRKPQMFEPNKASLAKALGYDPELFDHIWQNTDVPEPPPKPTDDERARQRWEYLDRAILRIAKAEGALPSDVLIKAIKRASVPLHQIQAAMEKRPEKRKDE